MVGGESFTPLSKRMESPNPDIMATAGSSDGKMLSSLSPNFVKKLMSSSRLVVGSTNRARLSMVFCSFICELVIDKLVKFENETEIIFLVVFDINP